MTNKKKKNYNYILFLPKNINLYFIIYKNYKYIYFFNQLYNLYFFLSFNQKIKINKNLNLIILFKIIKKKNFKNFFFYLNDIINNFYKIYYSKISFNGKGFRIKKHKNINNFFFNNSNIKVYIENNTKFIKIIKYIYIYIYKLKNQKKKINFFKNLFFFNIFTKKGIKLNKQIKLIKKFKKK